jgi:hypothetical protein
VCPDRSPAVSSQAQFCFSVHCLSCSLRALLFQFNSHVFPFFFLECFYFVKCTLLIFKLNWLPCFSFNIAVSFKPPAFLQKLFFSFFLQYWGLNSGPIHWSPSPALSGDFFQDRVSWTICPDWLQTGILLISASRVARIIGASHPHLIPIFASPILFLTVKICVVLVLVFNWDRVLLSCPSWPQTCNPPSSASQVAGITSMIHGTWLCVLFCFLIVVKQI